MTNDAVAAVARSVRTLTIDAVQAANSGHPGMPMGVAELGALLYGEVLSHTPEDPAWTNRDRFVLSAGHGSMFLYSLLHLAGYDISLEDIRNFRQLGYKTPGHPEYGHTPGVETTTGPLGQGLANAVGLAIAEQMTAAAYNTAAHTIVDHYTYVIVGDGCLMEGITGEASSLAGHLKLGKLIAFYDSNKISIEGSTDLAFTEDVAARYRAYGWQVLSGDAYDPDVIRKLVAEAKGDTERPTLIVLTSVIGKGSPNKAGTHGVHGAALGDDEVALSKKEIGVAEDAMFFIDPDAVAFFAARRGELTDAHAQWKATFDAWASANPGLAEQWRAVQSGDLERYLAAAELPTYEPGSKEATRKASGAAIKALAKALPNLVGGSADLAPSNNTAMPEDGEFFADSRDGHTLHFGVREHAMAAIGNGLALYGGLRPFVATFLVFADYLRPGLRLSALMNIPTVYILTHDSIFIGEDGPTHQPIEHLAALRAIPNVQVFRPADGAETNRAWLTALRSEGPTCLVLTRQGLPELAKPAGWEADADRGGYVVQDAQGAPDAVVLATGSEVSLAIDAAGKSGKKVRVVSVTSVERLLAQDEAFHEKLMPAGVPVYAAEAGIPMGWEAFTGSRDRVFGLAGFGASGPGAKVAEHFGFTAAKLTEMLSR